LLKDIVFDELQNTVSELLIYNRSILEIMAKVQENNARLHRSIINSITSCGCITIKATKSKIPSDAALADLRQIFDPHVNGELCDNCRENIEKAVGRSILYIAAICNSLDLNIYDIILKEQKQMKILGYYNMA